MILIIIFEATIYAEKLSSIAVSLLNAFLHFSECSASLCGGVLVSQTRLVKRRSLNTMTPTVSVIQLNNY